MHPSHHAASNPDKPAYIMATSGETVSYADLERRTNQGAQLFRALGLNIGDTVAILLDNDPRFLEIVWAAHRAGLYYTCLSTKLARDAAGFILADCGAKALITAAGFAGDLHGIVPPGVALLYVGTPPAGGASYEARRDAMPAQPIADEQAGSDMLYSSGTTGRPKGVKRALSGDPPGNPDPLTGLARHLFGFDADTVYLSPAPLYHAAPLRWCMAVQRLGGTVVVMEKFDAEQALALIERHRITAAQWVPTHFVRLLKLPEDIRGRYDMSSLRSAVHAAAPCPVPVKQAMIDWWGPIVTEYYSGTEGFGMTAITAPEWLERPGSVGRPILGTLHICDEAGNELPPGATGGVYFEGGTDSRYHNDPEKDADARNVHGWASYGDIGHVDEGGYLYLTDRKSFTIISGGVNIYPQEIENLLVTHEAVLDAAVIGAPDDEMGERVVAIVQPIAFTGDDPALVESLREFVRAELGSLKTPRQIDIVAELPRQPNGKLFKRQLQDEYRERVRAAG